MSEFVRRYDHQMLHALNRAWFGPLGYYNVGWWDEDTTSQEQACEGLVDRLIELLLPADGPLLDVGCGLGATTARLAARAPQVTGINLSTAQIEQARARYPSVAFSVMDAASLPLPPRSVGGMLSVEALLHVDPRQRFFERAAEVLAPGARLVATDLLCADRELFGAWMLPARNDLPDLQAYACAVEEAGLQVTRLQDVTEPTWRAFCRRRAAAAEGPLRAWFEELGHRGVLHYLVLVATAPGGPTG
jgi:MPBQ/MSBQ methyltransferase